MEERTALEHLSKLDGRPINQLLNEAIKIYLSQQSPNEARLQASLSALQEYRKRDPGFEHAIAAFVDAEAGLEDPIEGEPVEGRFAGGQFQPTGPVQNKIRELLRA
jgi:hypothetical protein